MIDLTLNINNTLGELDNLLDGLSQAIDDALWECGELVAKEEEKRTKGKLSQSFYTYRDGDTQVIDNSKEYAQYVEYGRGPVRAINAKALRFVIDGKVLFRKSVGPMKAQPFVNESIRAASPKFKSIYEKHINALIGAKS